MPQVAERVPPPRLAAGASVTHEIEQTGRDCVRCVRRDAPRQVARAAESRRDADRQGPVQAPHHETDDWESGNKEDDDGVEVGTVTDVRERVGDGMVITLASPANVVARRCFEQVGAGPRRGGSGDFASKARSCRSSAARRRAGVGRPRRAAVALARAEKQRLDWLGGVSCFRDRWRRRWRGGQFTMHLPSHTYPLLTAKGHAVGAR